MAQTRKNKQPNTQNILAMIKAASVSGVVADTAIFPIFRLKTLVMSEGADPKSAQQIKGFRQTCQVILVKQGLGGFYRGFSPVFFSAMPGTSLYFCGTEMTQQLTNKLPVPSAFGNAISGFAGQIFCSIVWTPAAVTTEARQLFLTKPEHQNLKVTGLMKQIYAAHGFKGFYRGFFPQLATFGPMNSLGNLLSQEIQKRAGDPDQQHLGKNFAINFGSFAVASYLTTPCDVVKTRIQANAIDPVKFPHRKIRECVPHVIKTEGFSALYNGAGYRTLCFGLRQGIALTLFKKAFDHFTNVSSANNDEINQTKAPNKLQRKG
jgi:hypothetical protein